jgi:hypothetical protein
MKEIQEGYDLLVRGGNAAARCSSMWADILRGEYYCGNLLWQSGLALLYRGHWSLRVSIASGSASILTACSKLKSMGIGFRAVRHVA